MGTGLVADATRIPPTCKYTLRTARYVRCLHLTLACLLLIAGGTGDAMARARSDASGSHKAPPLSATQPALPVLSLPTNVQDGDTIELECGRTYAGTLDLERRNHVTVKTKGSCGPAVITPAHPVEGWRRDPQDADAWITDMPFAPALLELDGRYLPQAHHPNSPSPWLTGTRVGADRLRAALPSADLVGANLVWRAADWLIQERRIARSDDTVLVLAPGDDEGFGLLPQTEF